MANYSEKEGATGKKYTVYSDRIKVTYRDGSSRTVRPTDVSYKATKDAMEKDIADKKWYKPGKSTTTATNALGAGKTDGLVSAVGKPTVDTALQKENAILDRTKSMANLESKVQFNNNVAKANNAMAVAQQQIQNPARTMTFAEKQRQASMQNLEHMVGRNQLLNDGGAKTPLLKAVTPQTTMNRVMGVIPEQLNNQPVSNMDVAKHTLESIVQGVKNSAIQTGQAIGQYSFQDADAYRMARTGNPALVNALSNPQQTDALAEGFAQDRIETAQQYADKMQEINEKYNADNFNTAQQLVGQVGTAVGQIAPAMLLGPAYLLPYMYGMSANQALGEGATIEQADDFAVLNTAKEFLIEMLVGGVPVGKMKSFIEPEKLMAKFNIDFGTANKVASRLIKALGEGGEEVLAGMAEPYLQRHTYDPDAENATLEELAWQFLIGAGAGGVFQGIDVANSRLHNRNQRETQQIIQNAMQNVQNQQNLQAENAESIQKPQNASESPVVADVIKNITTQNKVAENQSSQAKNQQVPLEMSERNFDNVKNKKVLAYQQEHPEIKPHQQEIASRLLSDLMMGQKGKVDAGIDPSTRNVTTMAGIHRMQSEPINRMLNDGLSYKEIEDGLKRIVEDEGAENTTTAKRVEMYVHDAWQNGYESITEGYVDGQEVSGDYVINQMGMEELIAEVERLSERLSNATSEKEVLQIEVQLDAIDKRMAQLQSAQQTRSNIGDATQLPQELQEILNRAVSRTSRLGMNINAVDSLTTPIGQQAPAATDSAGNIYLNANKMKDTSFIDSQGKITNRTARQILQNNLGHEIGHNLPEEAQRDIQDLAVALNEIMNPGEGRDGYFARKKQEYNDAGVFYDNDNLYWSEISSEAIGRMMEDDMLAKRAMRENPTAFQRILDAIENLIRKFKNRKLSADEKETLRILEDVQKRFSRGLNELEFEQYRNQGAVDAGAANLAYNLPPVDPIYPSSDKWKRSATFEEVKAAHPSLFELDSDDTEKANPTQISTTVKTYRNIYNTLKREGFDGKILDASSGKGYGTRAGIDEYGFDVDDIEPFPGEKYKPKYTDYSTLDEKYDVIISNAVLNVLTQELRDSMVVTMGNLLKDGGRMFINVRGADVKNATTAVAIDADALEYFIADDGSYQKGFKLGELKAYLQDVLGDGYSIERPKGKENQFGSISYIVTKKGGDVRYNSGDMETAQRLVDKGGLSYSLSKLPNQKYLAESDANLNAFMSGSQVVNDDGSPKVVYSGHGNTNLFGSSFNKSKATAGGFYFTANPEIASNYAKDKLGVKEYYENGDEYRIKDEKGKYKLQLRDIRLTEEQADKFDEWFEEDLGWTFEGFKKERGAYDYRYRYLSRYRLADLYWLMNELGYTLQQANYTKDGVKYSASAFEELMDAMGIEWDSYTKASGGVFPVYLSIKNPIDTSKPFPKDVMQRLERIASREKRVSYEEIDYTHWTADYPVYKWIEDIKRMEETGGETFWATQVPAKARKVLQEMGYDGIKDTGGKMGGEEHEVWIAFEPTQIKSAIGNRGTYDPTKKNMSYNIGYDSNGRELTPEQAEYFKDSKVRDAEGRLQEMYHGTSSYGFTVFDYGKAKFGLFGNGFYFTDNRDVAESYTEKGKGDSKGVYSVYLNVKNPLDMDTVASEEWQNVDLDGESINDYLDVNATGSLTNEDYFKALKNYCADNGMYQYEAEDYIQDTIWGMGFDGISHTGGGRYNKKDGTKHRVYIAFEQEQIKNTDNTNPTSDADIRYNLDYDEMVDEYGAMSKGENPFGDNRNINVPQQTSDFDKTRGFIGTAMEAEQVADETVDVIKDRMTSDYQDGSLQYEPVSNKETLAKANERIDSHKEDGWQIEAGYFSNAVAKGTRITAEDIAVAERCIQEAQKEGNYEAAASIISDLAIVGTEYGQAIQALSMLKRLSPEGQLKTLMKVQERINNQLMAQNKKPVMNITPEVQAEFLQARGKAKRDEIWNREIAKAAQQTEGSWADKLNALRYAAMLSNPRTHIRNLVGNFVMQAAYVPRNIISGALQDVRGGEQTHSLRGMFTNTTGNTNAELRNFANHDFHQNAKATLQNIGNRYDDVSGMFESQRKVFGNSVPGRVLEELAGSGKYSVGSMLDKEDMLFKQFTYQNALIDYMKANGLSVQDAVKGITKNGANIAKGRIYAIEQARKATFTEDNMVAEWLSKGEHKFGLPGAIVIGGAMPFKKTPTNILSRGIEFSPAGLTMTAYKLFHAVKGTKGRNGSYYDMNDVMDSLGANITGSLILVAGMILASQGLLRATDDDDNQRKNSYDYYMGDQNFAVVNPETGESWTIDWLAPAAMPLLTGVEVYRQLFGEGKEVEGGVLAKALESASKIADPVFEMSCMQGVASALASYSGDTGDIASSVMSNVVTGIGGQFVPQPLSAMARVIDDTVRSSYASKESPIGKGTESFLRQQVSKIPGASMTNEPSMNAWGEERKREFAGDGAGDVAMRVVNSFINPSTYSSNKRTELDYQLEELYRLTGNVNVLPKNATNYVEIGGKTYHKTPQEKTAYDRTRGQLSKQYVSDFVNSNAYTAMDNASKAKIVTELYDFANYQAKKDMLQKRGVWQDSFENSSFEAILTTGIAPAKFYETKFKLDTFKGDTKQDMYKSYLRGEVQNGNMTDEDAWYWWTENYTAKKYMEKCPYDWIKKLNG